MERRGRRTSEWRCGGECGWTSWRRGRGAQRWGWASTDGAQSSVTFQSNFFVPLFKTLRFFSHCNNLCFGPKTGSGMKSSLHWHWGCNFFTFTTTTSWISSSPRLYLFFSDFENGGKERSQVLKKGDETKSYEFFVSLLLSFINIRFGQSHPSPPFISLLFSFPFLYLWIRTFLHLLSHFQLIADFSLFSSI